MKKKTLLLAVNLLTLLLSGCSNKDESHRYIYLAAKYQLSYASINTTYEVSDDPAYYNQIPGNINCSSKFITTESYYLLNTKIIGGVASGFGSVYIKTDTCEYSANFEYVCNYTSVYGGVVSQINGTNINFLGKQIIRGRYQYARMEAFIPDVSDKRLIIEFGFKENLETPELYDYFNNDIY